MSVNKILTLALATTLFGCATTDHKTSQSAPNQAYKIEPTKPSDLIQADTAEQYYQIGRKYQKEGKYDLAITAFQKALLIENKNSTALQQDYTNSITGLATAYADQKLYFLAIPLFKEVVSINPNPANHNNLGYAYYLNGQYKEASQSLNQALALDQNYVQASKNLDLVNQHLNATIADENKPSEKQDAIVINQIDAMPNEAQTIEPIEEQVVRIQKEKQALNLNKVENAVYELKFDQPVQVAAVTSQQLTSKPAEKKTVAPLQVIASGGTSFKVMPAIEKLFDIANNMMALFTPSQQKQYIEVVNGNGLKGIARTVVSKLKEGGGSIGKYRVADANRFNKPKTYIQYKTGYRDDAVRLNHSLLNRPYLMRNDMLPPDTMIRLVLGKDLITQHKQRANNSHHPAVRETKT